MRGDRLKFLRESLGYTQEQLAEMLKKDIKQVWRWESGKASPSADTLANMANALGASADYLIGLSDEPTVITGTALSNEERELVGLYRNMNKKSRNLAANILRSIWDSERGAS